MLSWFRIGRYLQCPPRKEPLNTRSATCERSVRAVRFPRTQASRREDGVNCVERPVDQIHDFFPVLESSAERVSQVLRDETREQAGREKRARTGSEKNATASVECQRDIINAPGLGTEYVLRATHPNCVSLEIMPALSTRCIDARILSHCTLCPIDYRKPFTILYPA